MRLIAPLITNKQEIFETLRRAQTSDDGFLFVYKIKSELCAVICGFSV